MGRLPINDPTHAERSVADLSHLRRSRTFRRIAVGASFAASGILVGCGYVFLSDDHRIDRILLLGLPDPDGAITEAGRLTGIAWSLTSLGSPEIVFIAACAVLGFFLLSGRFNSAIFLIFAVAGGAVGGYAAKTIFGSFRPHHVPGTTNIANTSFPSGHALLITLLTASLAVIATRSTDHPLLRAYVWSVGVVIAFLVGVSRIYLGTHWPSDVIAGWTAGLLWVLITERFFRQSSFGPDFLR
ncbi:MAG: phosphatase PAP2 family protein [Dechloromonas sp.]|nr:phosphatase PAP2 family protein [Dechloromonas sp.]